MRNLAQQKYGLKMMEAHLPSQTLEQVMYRSSLIQNIAEVNQVFEMALHMNSHTN